MKPVGRVIAWICIFCTLFMGCYSSVMVDPTGPDKQKICSETITSVVTRDGREYEFDIPPSIINDAIVGVITVWPGPTTYQVSIPISDLARVSMSELDTGRTIGAIVGSLGIVGVIMLVLEPPELRYGR